jgi:hypothetical protein
VPEEVVDMSTNKKRQLKTGGREASKSHGDIVPPRILKVRQYLDSLDLDEVRTITQICFDLGYRHSSMKSVMHLVGEEYRDHCESLSFYSYGNPKTIKAWREGAYDG